MEFKKGDILEFTPLGVYNAKKGAKAIYQGETTITYDGGELIEVKWIRDKLSGDQKDGGYFSHMFKKCKQQEL
jgi:hypothetical protein